MPISPASLTQRGGLAVSRLDGRGITLSRTRSRVLPLFRVRYQTLGAAWVRRIGCRRTLSSRADAPLAATLTRLATAAFYRRLVSGGPATGGFRRWPRVSYDTVAGRRLSPCPPFLASHGLTIPLKVGLHIRSLFHFRRAISRSTTSENIRASSKIRMLFQQGVF